MEKLKQTENISEQFFLKIEKLINLWERFKETDEGKEALNEALVEFLNSEKSDAELLRILGARIRDERKGTKIKLVGTVEISNVCRVNCLYCSMRRDNLSKDKIQRISKHDLVASIKNALLSGCTEVFVQSGEDPQIVDVLIEALNELKEELGGVKIVTNLGDLDSKQYLKLKNAGVTQYVSNFETSNIPMHERLREHSFSKRVSAMKGAQAVGMDLGSGFIIGFDGQTNQDIANDLCFVNKMNVRNMTSVTCFTPSEETPLAHEKVGDVEKTLNVIALLRILYPDFDIPIPPNSNSEKLNYNSPLSGMTLAYQAGANTVYENFTPESVKSGYGIYNIANKRPVVTKGSIDRLIEETDRNLLVKN